MCYFANHNSKVSNRNKKFTKYEKCIYLHYAAFGSNFCISTIEQGC